MCIHHIGNTCLLIIKKIFPEIKPYPRALRIVSFNLSNFFARSTVEMITL